LLLEKQNWLHSLKSGGGVPHVYPKDVANLKVPVPPLEVQREIVRILDHFTELEAELGAELEARHKQYEHYRNELLTFTEDEVRWVPMGELLRIRNGRDYKHLGKGNVPVFGSGGIMAYVDQHLTANPTVLIPRKGSLGNLYYVDQPVWTVDTIFYTEIDAENLQPKYLFHFLKTQDLAGMNQAGGVPSLTQSMLSKLVVPLPAMGRQQEIVDILEKFEAFVNDISGGLPAEIEARRKQYEYYRGKLLTFAEVAS
jgi:type I restriction enzyme S subunit